MFKKIMTALILAAVLVSVVSCTPEDGAVTTDITGTSAVTDAATGAPETEAEKESTATSLEVLNAAVAEVKNITDGTVCAEPEADEAKKMEAVTFSTFFGYSLSIGDDGMPTYPEIYSSIENYAVRIPVASTDVMEVDVIKFKSGTAASDMEALCQSRMTKIKNDYASNANYDADGSKKKHVDGMTFKLFDNYAVLICADDTTAAFAAAEELINSKKI